MLAVSVLTAITVLHKHGITYGALKSADVLVDVGTMGVKLTSYGMLSAKYPLLAAGVLAAPETMPPELYMFITNHGDHGGEDTAAVCRKVFTKEADVYALATVPFPFFYGVCFFDVVSKISLAVMI